MPELPEVETVRRGLDEFVVGREIKHVQVRQSPRSFPNAPADVTNFVVGAHVTTIGRRGKMLLINLSSKYTLMTHLRMTGQLVFIGPESLRFAAGHPNNSLIGALPDKSTRVVVTFRDGSHLYFNDQRRFGFMKLVPTVEVVNDSFMRRIGPEPLVENFTARDFISRIRRRNNTSIKAAILDQSVLAGVGNIYADESLWAAKIHPATHVRALSDRQLANLLVAIKAVLNLSIEKGGSTNHTYVNIEGGKGTYMDFAQVFRRQGQPCQRHPAVLIEKIRVAGRGTHICPVCQVEVIA